jgi:hypothetical protein
LLYIAASLPGETAHGGIVLLTSFFKILVLTFGNIRGIICLCLCTYIYWGAQRTRRYKSFIEANKQEVKKFGERDHAGHQ